MRSFACVALVVCLSVASGPSASAEGAIAFGQAAGSWAFGSSDNYQTRTAARERALSECGKHHSSCKVIAAFNNGCGALAVQQSGNQYAIGWGAVPRDAEKRAFDGCLTMGTACDVKPAVCDSVMEPTLLCVRPIFSEKRRLEALALDRVGDNRAVEDALKASLYLEAKYCVRSSNVPPFQRREKLAGPCFQFAGTMLGDAVYWSNCPDFGGDQ